MEKISKFDKFFKINKILEPIFDGLLVVSLSTLLYALLGRIFPERYFVSEMDAIMIRNGEDITLILIYLASSMIIFSFIVRLILNLIININIFCGWKPNFGKNEKVIMWTLYTVNVLNTVVPLFFLFFHYLIDHFKKTNKLIMFENQNKKKDNISRLVLGLAPFAISGMVASPILVVTMSSQRVVVNEIAIKNNLTFSNNHNNTLFLYFDRSLGSLWNLLLKVDQITNKDNSFISQNPGFTSFLNVLSNSNATNISNMTITGGMWFLPYLFGNNDSFVNPIDNIGYENISQDNAYGRAFLSQIKLLDEYNVRNISYMDVPYFGKKFTELHGEYWTLNSYFKNNGFPNATSTSSTAVLKYANQKYDNDSPDGLRYLQYISDKNNLTFKNTDSGYAKFLYHQITHESYTFLNDDGDIKRGGTSFKNFLRSMWTVINQLKTLFNELRSEKYYGTDKNGDDDNVYNHTFITIISDHGIKFNLNQSSSAIDYIWNNYFNNDDSKFFTTKEKLKTFLNKYNYADKQDWIVNPASFNSVFMIKPINSKSNFSFDTTHFVTSADYNLFLEEQLSKNNKLDSSDLNKTVTFSPIVDSSKYSDSAKKYIIDAIVKDPLQNLDKLNNRTIIAMSSKSWKWKYSDKSFHMTDYLLKAKAENNKTIYDSIYYSGNADELVW